jgi:hypothetical protein
LTIFFNGVNLITMDALRFGARFTQKYLINNILFHIIERRGRILRRVRRGDFLVQTANPICRNGHMVTDVLANLKRDHVPRPPDSPDLDSCVFWLFRMLKQKIKDRMLQTIEEIMTAVHRVWNERT